MEDMVDSGSFGCTKVHVMCCLSKSWFWCLGGQDSSNGLWGNPHVRYLKQVTYVVLKFSAVFPRRFPWNSAKTSAARPHPFRVLPARIPRKALQPVCALQTVLISDELRSLGNSFGFWSIRRHSLLKTIFNLNLTFETKNRLRQTASLNASNFPTTLERTGRWVETANTMNSSLRTQSFWTTC